MWTCEYFEFWDINWKNRIAWKSRWKWHLWNLNVAMRYGINFRISCVQYADIKRYGMHASSTISIYYSHLKAFIDKFPFSRFFFLPLIFWTTINMMDALSLFTIHIYWNYMFIHAWFFFISQYGSHEWYSMPGIKWNLFRCMLHSNIFAFLCEKKTMWYWRKGKMDSRLFHKWNYKLRTSTAHEKPVLVWCVMSKQWTDTNFVPNERRKI